MFINYLASIKSIRLHRIFKIAIISFVFFIALSLAFINLKSWLGIGYDDAYITFRYAHNLGQGIGYRFNTGSDVNSASPLLFGLLLGLIGLIQSSAIPYFALVLNILGFAAIIVGVVMWSVSENKSRTAKMSGAIIGVSITSSGFLGYWMFSGMETIFCAGLLTLSLYGVKSHFAKAARGNLKPRRIISLILFFLGFARLELSFIAIALGGWFFIATLSLRNPLEAHNFRVRFKIGIVPLLAALSVPIFTLLFFKFYYGNIVPDPIRFKRLVNYYFSDPKSQWLISKSFIVTHFGYVAITAAISLGFLLLKFRRNYESFASLLPLVAFVSIVPSILNSPNSDFYRYQIFLIPLLGLMASSIFKNLNHPAINAILAVVLVFFSLKTVNQGIIDYQTMRDIAVADIPIQRDRATVGKWLEQNTPDGSTVWSGDLGAISFNNPSNLYFDGGGLTNREIIESVENGTDFSAAICAAHPDYVADSIDIATDSPSVVWILDKVSSYYSSETGNATTTRKSTDLFTLTNLYRANGNGSIGIGVYKINWHGC